MKLNFFLFKKLFWLFLIGFWAYIIWVSFEDRQFDLVMAVRETGRLSWYLLMFTIYIGLLKKLFPRVILFGHLLPLRKQTGVAAFLIAGAHGIFEFLNRGIVGDWPAILARSFSLESATVFGSIGFLIMLPLFLTSTDWAVKKMGTVTWKRLHRLAHLAFVAAALHIILNDYFTPEKTLTYKTIVALGLYIGGYVSLWVKRAVAKKTQSVTPPPSEQSAPPVNSQPEAQDKDQLAG